MCAFFIREYNVGQLDSPLFTASLLFRCIKMYLLCIIARKHNEIDWGATQGGGYARISGALDDGRNFPMLLILDAGVWI